MTVQHDYKIGDRVRLAEGRQFEYAPGKFLAPASLGTVVDRSHMYDSAPVPESEKQLAMNLSYAIFPVAVRWDDVTETDELGNDFYLTALEEVEHV